MHIDQRTDIHEIIDACRKKDSRAQEILYREYYGFAMGIVRRYTRSRDEASEIVNDGFFKALTNLEKYSPELSFPGWIRRIMLNTAIDNYRRNEKHYNTIDISYSRETDKNPDALSKLSEEEILNAISELPASYRMVFCLHVIEGYSHEEIGHLLGISAGTSKSNLSVARAKLMKLLGSHNQSKFISNG